MDEIKEPKGGCITAALKILGDKWSALIIRELTIGPRRFSSLEAALPGISPRTLSQRLELLLEHDVVAKRIYCETPPRAEYELTPKGEDLIPIIKSMVDWGSKHSSPRQLT